MNTGKPRIKRVAIREQVGVPSPLRWLWQCRSTHSIVVGHGNTPDEAYAAWKQTWKALRNIA